MTQFKKTFHTHIVAELDTDIDGEGTTQCIVTYRKYSATLAALEGTGYLEDKHGNQWEPDLAMIEDISVWATSKGY